jgi:hypothetical protein
MIKGPRPDARKLAQKIARTGFGFWDDSPEIEIRYIKIKIRIRIKTRMALNDSQRGVRRPGARFLTVLLAIGPSDALKSTQAQSVRGTR